MHFYTPKSSIFLSKSWARASLRRPLRKGFPEAGAEAEAHYSHRLPSSQRDYVALSPVASSRRESRATTVSTTVSNHPSSDHQRDAPAQASTRREQQDQQQEQQQRRGILKSASQDRIAGLNQTPPPSPNYEFLLTNAVSLRETLNTEAPSTSGSRLKTANANTLQIDLSRVHHSEITTTTR